LICPKCKSSRFFQTDEPTRFICIDCKTEYRLEEIKETETIPMPEAADWKPSKTTRKKVGG